MPVAVSLSVARGWWWPASAARPAGVSLSLSVVLVAAATVNVPRASTSGGRRDALRAPPAVIAATTWQLAWGAVHVNGA